MRTAKLTLAVSMALAATAAQAAGPLYLWDGGSEPTPYRWDTSESIPVYTDGGEAFTFDYDDTVFISIERADEITQFAFDQWNAVSTSTFQAGVVGKIGDVVEGVDDVIGANAHEIYGVFNGGGFFVNYDTDGSILEEFFGVPRSAVLGIAFPEWADEETGEITEATAVINGWNVYVNDTEGNQVAGVFTHEFGHAINLSHSQVNGQMAYYSYTYAPKYPGVPGCDVEASYRWDYPPFYEVPTTDPAVVETMFPFIDHSGEAGEAMSHVTHADDMAGISNLYPSGDYASSTGSISGVLRLKDGNTEYSGINVIARNVNDLMGDAVSAMTGDQTQGMLGPDGRFTINNLTPGEEYVLYIEAIVAGGYPTRPQALVSVGEYWNAAESNNPSLDNNCEATPILAEAGVTKSADITFNGYLDGVQLTPIVQAFLVDMAKNGKSASGQAPGVAFSWDMNHGFKVLPEEIKPSNSFMTRNGQKMTVLYDHTGNGIQTATLFDFQGNSLKGKLVDLGDLNGNTCGGGGASGVSSSYAWAVDDAGHTVVGTAYLDKDGDGGCQTSSKGEVVPFIWTDGKHGGMRQLPVEGAPSQTSWIRADRVSGNGKVVLGNNGGSKAVAWVEEGELVNLYEDLGARYATAVNQDGTRVAMQTDGATLLWNPMTDTIEDIGGLVHCVDVPYNFLWFGDLCEQYPAEYIWENVGKYMSVLPTDMNDEGSIIIGRAGSFFGGFFGAIWIEGVGWMDFNKFLQRQGVVEADGIDFANPLAVDGQGDDLVGGIPGAMMSWYVEMSSVYVCSESKDVLTSFPEGMMSWVGKGAEIGRCAFID